MVRGESVGKHEGKQGVRMVAKQTRMTAREWTEYQRTTRYDRITPAGGSRYDVSLPGGRVLLRVTVEG